MTLDRLAQPLDVVVVERLERDHLVVDERREHAFDVVDVRDATRHARAEVAPGRAEHDDTAAGHVLAAVVADTLDDGGGTGVAHAEALADDAADVRLARRRAVQHHVPGDDVLLGRERRVAIGAQHEVAAREPLADVVVGVALEPQRDAVRHEGAEALPGRAAQLHVDGVVGQAHAAVALRDLGAEQRADGAVHVADRRLDVHGPTEVERGLRLLDELLVERAVEAVILLLRAEEVLALVRVLGHREDGREVESVRLPVVDRRARVEHLGVTDRLGDRAEAELGEVLAHLFGDELEEVDDELRLAREALAQLGVLRGDADRARVEVADAHHHAAAHHERRGREAELLGTEQRGDDDVAPGLELAVALHDDAVAQPVAHERLLRLGDAELPRRARVLERRERRGAGAAVVPGDQDDVAVRLGHARGHRADTDLGHQLHVDARGGLEFLRSWISCLMSSME